MPDTPSTSDFPEGDPLASDSGQDEFVRLFTRDRRKIYSYVYSLVPVTAEAEDIFQQVSLTLWKRYAARDQEASFFKWACSVAYYTVQNYRRKSLRSKIVFTDELFEQLAEEGLEWADKQAERYEYLRQCLDRLREPDQKLVARVYHEGKTPQSVADETGRTRQGVYNRLSFIRKRLLECVNAKIAASGHTSWAR